jgi:hypothetical protein
MSKDSTLILVVFALVKTGGNLLHRSPLELQIKTLGQWEGVLGKKNAYFTLAAT